MQINLNVKIKGGPRTQIDIEVYGTSVNEKIMKFKNGNEIKESSIAEWLQRNLLIYLKGIQDKT